MMTFPIRRIFALGLLAVIAPRAWGQTCICGTVTLPGGESFATGAIRVKLNFLSPNSVNHPEVDVNAALRNYCVEGLASEVHSVSATVTLRNGSGQTKTFSTHKFRWEEGGVTETQISGFGKKNFVLDFAAHINADINQSTVVFHGKNEDAGLSQPDWHFLPNSNYFNKVVSSTFGNGNLIANGSFEAQGEPERPVDWEMIKGNGWSFNPNSGIQKFVNISVSAKTGNQVVGIRYSTNGENPKLMVSPLFPLEPNTNYILSFYYRTMGMTGNFRPALELWANSNFNPATPGDWSSAPNYINPGEWSLYTFTFNSGEDAKLGQLSLLETVNGTSGVFFFDDVLLEKQNTASSLTGSHELTQKGTTFFNGMNRLVQTMQIDNNRDIITGVEYDELGRTIVSSLPVGHDYLLHTGRHGFYERLFSAPEPGNLEWFYSDFGYPYTETFYENSPLGRMSRVHSPGEAWRTAERHIEMHYSATDNTSPSQGTETAPEPNSNPKYFYKLTVDEEGTLAREFTDKNGLKVKTSVKDGLNWIDTDYMYDGLGNLIETVAPAGQSGRQSTQYTYNSLKQLLKENSNDLGETEFVYDKMGRIRFSQDAVQRDNFKFSYTRYDEIGRVVEQGESDQIDAFTQLAADDPAFPSVGSSRQVRVVNIYDEKPKMRNWCGDAEGGWEYFARSDFSVSNYNEYPSIDAIYDVLVPRMAERVVFTGSVNIYQIFDTPEQVISPIMGKEFQPLNLMPPTTEKVGFQIEGVLRGSERFHEITAGKSFPFTTEWGPLHGRLVQTVVCNTQMAATPLGTQPLYKLFNYDKYGNLSQVFEYNGYVKQMSKRWHRAEQKHDIQNRLVQRKVYPDEQSTVPEVAYTYTYDHLGRLDKIRDAANAIVAEHNYNSLGQLTVVDLGRGAAPVRVFYEYDARGALNEIKATALGRGEIYLQKIRREDADAANGEEARYDGNIAAYNYQLMGMAEEIYKFKYDDLNRLKEAYTTKATDLKPESPLSFLYDYHDNGSINSVTRGSQVFDYQYVSNTNQLDHVGGTASQSRNLSATGNFQYDGSGRMKVDASKDMDIEYDTWANRPLGFHRGEGPTGTSVYAVYDEAGNRKSKFTLSGSAILEAKHYFRGKELREFPTSGVATKEVYDFDQYGRVVKNHLGVSQYEINIKNHIGSTVEIFNTTSDILAFKADYEPFGRIRSEIQNTDEVSAKFTSKENDEEIGLDYFGARYYDSDLALWISPDAARQYHSSYSYSLNPINGTDPDGRKFNQLGNNLYAIAEHYKFWGSKTLEGDLKMYKESNKVFNIAFEDLPGMQKGATRNIAEETANIFLDPKILNSEYALIKTFRHELQHGANPSHEASQLEQASWHKSGLGYYLNWLFAAGHGTTEWTEVDAAIVNYIRQVDKVFARDTQVDIESGFIRKEDIHIK